MSHIPKPIRYLVMAVAAVAVVGGVAMVVPNRVDGAPVAAPATGSRVVATLPPAVTPAETLYLEVVRPLVPKAWTGATDDGLLQIGYSSCELLRTSDGDRVSALAALSRVMVGKPAEDVTFAGYAFTAAEQVLCPELRR